MQIKSPAGRERTLFRLRTRTIVIITFATMLGLIVVGLWYAVPAAREAARRAQCRNNLKQIGVGLYNYWEVYKSLPPAHIVGGDGRRTHSWRVLLLPFMSCDPLSARYRWDEPWDGPNNRMLHSKEKRLYTYLCPSDPEAPISTRTDYLAVVGPGTAWPGATSAWISFFSSGATNTIFLVEDTQRNIHWMEPRDLELDQFDYTINSSSGRGISTNHGRGANVLMVDGSVRYLPADTSPDVVESLIKLDARQE